MKRLAKLGCLSACKYLGIFWLFRRLNRNGIRILCYHGLAVASDQSRFRPKLFMASATFRKRMAWLRRHGYRVISLDEAVDALRQGKATRDAVVITMDDGFYGSFLYGIPIAMEFGYPVTVYVTTWYVENHAPVVGLVQQYEEWRGAAPEADRRFTLMTAAEIAEAARCGIDIQLHTHRHRWPSSADELRREIADNRRVLMPLVSKSLCHFCYPSGTFTTEHWPLLRELGITSATTLERGMVRSDDHPLRLPRLLDGSNLTPIEFQARMCGLLDLLQETRRRFRSFARSAPRRAAPAD